MIENYKALLKPGEEELHERLEQAHARLFAQQMQMEEKRKPFLTRLGTFWSPMISIMRD